MSPDYGPRLGLRGCVPLLEVWNRPWGLPLPIPPLLLLLLTGSSKLTYFSVKKKQESFSTLLRIPFASIDEECDEGGVDEMSLLVVCGVV